jgi:hypothetical protein
MGKTISWQSIHPVRSLPHVLLIANAIFSDDVQFTFSQGMDIPLKYRTSECTVATFWNTFTKVENQYFKKASIAACTAEITMLVPIEITVRPSPHSS